MRLKTILAAIALATLPGVAAMADCSWGHSKDSASQCGDGFSYDETTRSCVRITTS